LGPFPIRVKVDEFSRKKREKQKGKEKGFSGTLREFRGKPHATKKRRPWEEREKKRSLLVKKKKFAVRGGQPRCKDSKALEKGENQIVSRKEGISLYLKEGFLCNMRGSTRFLK